MFKQVFRLTFVTVIWKQYKQVIVSTLALFLYLWLVGSIHEDYLAYEQDRSAIGLSFILKWAAFAVGVMLYMLFHWLRPRKKSQKRSWFKSSAGKTSSEQPVTQDGEDPFDDLRHQKKLRTRAEIIIDEKKKPSGGVGSPEGSK